MLWEPQNSVHYSFLVSSTFKIVRLYYASKLDIIAQSWLCHGELPGSISNIQLASYTSSRVDCISCRVAVHVAMILMIVLVSELPEQMCVIYYRRGNLMRSKHIVNGKCAYQCQQALSAVEQSPDPRCTRRQLCCRNHRMPRSMSKCAFRVMWLTFLCVILAIEILRKETTIMPPSSRGGISLAPNNHTPC